MFTRAHKFCPAVIYVPSAPCGRAGRQRTGHLHQRQTSTIAADSNKLWPEEQHGSRLGLEYLSWFTPGVTWSHVKWFRPSQMSLAETPHVISLKSSELVVDKNQKLLLFQPGDGTKTWQRHVQICCGTSVTEKHGKSRHRQAQTQFHYLFSWEVV